MKNGHGTTGYNKIVKDWWTRDIKCLLNLICSGKKIIIPVKTTSKLVFYQYCENIGQAKV